MYLCMYEKLCNAQCFAYSQECIECRGGVGHLSQCHTPSLSPPVFPVCISTVVYTLKIE